MKVITPEKKELKNLVIPKQKLSARPGLEFLGCTILIVIALEILFSFAGVGEQECLKVDQNLGFSHFENKLVTWRREGFSRSLFNSYGMPDREYSLEKPSGVRRIAVTGDSYVEALQLDRDKNFCRQLEKRLGEKYQVMNFGVQAHNLAQSYLNTDSLIMKFSPDLLIVPFRPEGTFLLPPDLKTGFLSARPNIFVDSDGELIIDRTVQEIWNNSREGKRMKATEWLRKHSRIWGIIAGSMEQFCKWKRDGGLLSSWLHPNEAKEAGMAWTENHSRKESKEENTALVFPNTSQEGEEAIKFSWPVAAGIIEHMKLLCEKNNCRMIIVRMPGVDGHSSNVESELLFETTRSLDIPTLDLTKPFQDHLLNYNDKLFLTTHFSEAGHRLVTEEIASFLMDKRFLAPGN